MNTSPSAGRSGKVYIANVTQQNHTINFRIPESRKPLSISIPMGQQRFVGDFSPPEIDAMVDQLGPYGLAELGQADKKSRLAYVFSVGTPVPSAAMARLIDQNKGILRKEGATRRQEAAVAAHNLMNTADTPMKDVEVSVEEVDSGTLGNDSENIAEGVKIANVDDTASRRGRNKNRRN